MATNSALPARALKGDKGDTGDTGATGAAGGSGTADGSGTLSIDVAGGSTTTLTATQSANGNIETTGAITANKSLNTFDATPRAYFIKNSATGAFTLTFKTPSGTGVVVPAGTSAQLYCDGTNIIGKYTRVTGTTPLKETAFVEMLANGIEVVKASYIS